MDNSSPWFRSETSKDEKGSSKNRQNVSFKFSKLAPKALSGNKLTDDPDLKRETVLSVENKEIKSLLPKEEKKELVVAPILKNVWRNSSSNFREVEDSQETSSKKSINELAIEELLKESAAKKANWEKREPPNIKIPMVIQNKLPEGFETNDKLDITLRAADSTLEDFVSVPVEDFGFAVLRGLGCNPGDPIGNKTKKYVAPIEALPRAKGLGLGADRQMQRDSQQTKEGKDEIKLCVGSYICVAQGIHKGLYGVVEGLDESRVIVKLNQWDKSISLPVLSIDVISKKEFQKESKVINKESYDKYKDEHVIKNGKDSNHRSKDDRENGSDERESSGEFQDRRESQSHHSKHRHSPELKRKHSSQKKSHKKHSSHHAKESRHDSWVHPLLRVRFIDEKYKKGKYFNEKMVIEDVVSVENCVCKTEDGKYLEDIRPSMLETVIPRTDSGHVMIVKGKHKAQLGVILNRNKKECIATVQLLSDRSKVVIMDYDSICEYMGDTSSFD